MSSNADFDRQSPGLSVGSGAVGHSRPVPAAIQLHAPSLYRAPANTAEQHINNAAQHRDECTPLSPTRRSDAQPSSPGNKSHSGKHWWLDFVPLPYWLVAPKMLREKVAKEKEEEQQKKQKSGGEASGDGGGGSNSKQGGESKDAEADANVSRRTRASMQQARRRTPSSSPPAPRTPHGTAITRDGGSQSAASQHPPDSSHPLALRQARLNFLRHLFAELIGTLVLVFAHGMLRIKDQLKEISPGDDALFAGATLVLLIYSLGEVSGAHFNPVVTLSFVLRNMFPWVWILPYWIAQFIGSLIAGALLRGFYGAENAYRAASYVSPSSLLSDWSAMGFEVAITFLLVFVILSVCQRVAGSIIGVHAALAVGATIALCVALGANITGGCMNPFRTLGPAIVSPPSEAFWPCVLGPFLGALLACLINWTLAAEDESPGRGPAMGKGKQAPDDEAD